MLTCIVSACCSQWVRAKSSMKSVGVAWVVASVVKLFGGLWAFVGLVMKVVGTVLAVLRLRCLQSLWCRQSVDGTVQFAS